MHRTRRALHVPEALPGLQDKEAEDTDRSWMEAIHYCLRIQGRAGREAEGGCSDGDGVAVRDGVEGAGCSEGDYR